MKDVRDIDLLLSEKWYLFKLRFKKRDTLPDKFFKLYKWKQVKENYIEQSLIPDETFSLTEKYWRYCAYRRDCFFNGSIWPSVISGIVSLIVSVLTTLLTLRLSGVI